MRGKVLSYSDSEGNGLISGDDGARYTFTRGDLQSGVRSVVAGAEVDFHAEDGKAVQIYLVTNAVGEKSKVAAALLAFFLGVLGVHKFYLGKTGAGFIMLLCGTIGWFLVLPGVIVALIAFIEFIIYLTKSDQQFHQDYVVGNKSWF